MALRKSARSTNEWFDGAHKFEHWYRDNTVYLITARVRDKRPLFTTPETQAIFWHRFDHWTTHHRFAPWITTLMSNHYHTIGYVERADGLGEMMRKLHGSVAMLVCKSLGITHKPFWLDDHHRDYFDGCLRDETQLRRSYAYVRDQAVKARLVSGWRDYPNTRVQLDLEPAVAFADARDAWLPEVPYARYEDRSRKRGRDAIPVERQPEQAGAARPRAGCLSLLRQSPDEDPTRPRRPRPASGRRPSTRRCRSRST